VYSYSMAGKKKTDRKIIVTPPATVFRLWAWILLAWGLYRYFIKLPEWTDEFFFKPLVFVVPVVWYVLKKERRTLESLGLTGKKFMSSVYIGLGFGMMFALEGILTNSIKNGTLAIKPITALAENGLIPLLIISLATAFSEEVLNRGFIFKRLFESTKNIYYSVGLSSLMFVFLHIPILVTSTHLNGPTLLLFVVTNLIIACINSLLFVSTGSLVAPILVHVFWNMTVALYL
jgi:membrane protease YdiL (CAAX protease family)